VSRDARVSAISVAAVKGLAVRRVEAVDVGTAGVAENRRLHLVDATGRFVNGKTSMRLSLVASRLDLAAGTLALEFPEGGAATGEIALGEPIETVFFGRPAPGRLVLGPWNAALSAWSALDLRLVMSDEVGAANDRGPDAGVSIVSSASVEDLAREGGVAGLDARRFRMLFEVDGVAPYAEDGWIGRDVRIGDAVVRPRGNVGRCVVTTCDPATGERDFDTLGVLAAYRGDIGASEPLPLGVVGDVVTPGRVHVGDAVAPL
jgi:MOSC domain-containing protein